MAEMLRLLSLYAVMRHHVSQFVDFAKGILFQLGIPFGFPQPGSAIPLPMGDHGLSLARSSFICLFQSSRFLLTRLSRRWLIIACCGIAVLSLASPLLYLTLHPDGVPYFWTREKTHYFGPRRDSVAPPPSLGPTRTTTSVADA
jgi:hypothetical protein